MGFIINRAAKVGEKIRIVNSHASCYANGDEATVIRKYEDSGGVLADFGQIYDWLVPRDAYVVLEPETKITEYRQVKRKAKVGETVKIIRSVPPYYNEKDIAKVYEVSGSAGGVRADFTLNEDYHCDGKWRVRFDDYVVFEPTAKSDEISDIKNEMERLTGELATLALRVSKLEEPAQQDEKSPQQIRDEIVEKAKADIEGLAISNYEYVNLIRHHTGGNLSPFYRIRDGGRAMFAEFIVNRKKKTVVCLLRGAITKEIYARGIAKCAPGDVFNSHIGRAIALRRALGMAMPTEYMSVPNPTEFKIGDIVIRYSWVNTMHQYLIFQIVTKPSIDSIDNYCDVIDDSHEEGTLDAYLT